MIQKIGVAGAGTMGSGIALNAAQSGFKVILFDTQTTGIENAQKMIAKNVAFLESKVKITAQQAAIIHQNIQYTTNINDCIADVIIEAIVENMEVKTNLYQQLAAINSNETILASNTSSLSISSLQKNIATPQRVVGMHFFNPAHVMKLVEVVAGEQTDKTVVTTIYNLCIQLGKQPVICNDAPGFIVNRVARHFYLEAMHMASTTPVSIADIDALMENIGFKMGPFKLMDLIGMDINYAVSQSVYHAFNDNPRFMPSPMQAAKVAAGELGRKTGKGFYDYSLNTPS
ncbi:3-hydroxyacyl-CoA dehydrogenase family protein [Ferruginibacter yonginensis]|uniref:3-hydroxyacyl-CoA dehydrogenase family protein n=1 Tax=Ferruginibacter yonginensis TaxID=1310416 RepID=A0ABV8QRH7_9BACT